MQIGDKFQDATGSYTATVIGFTKVGFVRYESVHVTMGQLTIKAVGAKRFQKFYCKKI